jgi:predicted nuclease of restriction endonuclease-like (RecB) superfamily
MSRLINSSENFYNKVSELLKTARETVIKSVNNTMVITYFEIGKLIVNQEQHGEEKAKYGKNLINELSEKLSTEFGKGFSATNIKQMRSFYVTYSKGQTASDEFNLSWSHYIKLMRIDDENERKFYEIESFKNNWSLKELQRQYDSALYARLTLSRDKNKIIELSEKGMVIEKPKDVIKDPYILEFIGLPEYSSYSESDLEQKLIDKLEHFLLELGTGFTFVARQKRITFDEKHFRIDLVFYNRILKSFVLVDLKIGELKHQDIGQMQMYVNYYDREIKLPDENKTIGLILCQNKSESVVQYTLPENNEQIFASKYQTVLPTKEKLKELLNI